MIIKSDILIKRISSRLEFRRDITRYGKDNIYPQKVEEIMFRSSTTSQAVKGLKAFTIGQGFEQNGDLIINRHDQTINAVLGIAAADFSLYGGFALHYNINEIFQITEVTNLDFKNVRFGLPDADGIHRDVKVNQNWEEDPQKTISRTERIFTFPLWQRRDFINMDEFDIEESRGFIMYYTPTPDQYPKATFDPVLDSAQTDAEIQIYELSNIQSGFIGANIFKHAGKIEGEPERQKLENDLRELQGAENANSIMIVETPPNFEGDIIETVAGNQNADLFNTVSDKVVARIMANFGQPFPIAGIQPPNAGIFNQEQMRDSLLSYNARTRNERFVMAEVFNRFMDFWESGAIELGAIIELQFEEQQTENDGGTDIDNEE